MLLFIIDGFNLVHKIASLKSSSFPQRDLIHYINKNRLTGSRNNKVIIAFDGKADPEAARSRGVEVLFSGDRSADEVIKKRLEKIKNRSQVVVVSDDLEIRDAARAAGAKICRTADFIKKKRKKEINEAKEIDYSVQREITEELRKIWLKE